MRSGLTLACLAALAMSACASPGPSHGQGDASVSGQATFYEKLLMPVDAVLAIDLIDLSRGATIQHAEFAGHPGPPYAFELRYDPHALPPDARLGIRATLSHPDGERVFATPSPIPVSGARTEPETFRMFHLP